VADEVDGFGCDAVFQQRARHLLDFLFHRYWRIKVMGIENIPASGRAMLVGNHSGGLPYDALMLMHAVQVRHPSHRLVRPLIEDSFWHLPFAGALLRKLGCVRANPDNAERLLRQESVLGVFPEGLKGLGKPFRDRYRLQRFGRGGFIKLALRTASPVVPVAIVGAEEIHPMLGKITWPLTLSGLPYLAITPTFPWLGPLGFLPLPTRWLIRVGTPVELGARGPADEHDQVRVNQLSERVRSEIQRMVDDALAGRHSVFRG
jgi:1-acyl-sn-glycerol-3-phosphate acyltransferase